MPKKTCFLVAALAVPAVVSAAVTITIDKIQQRWPWNNKVDITYTISDSDGDLDGRVGKVVLTSVIEGITYIAYDGAPNVDADVGTHTVTWENPPAGVKREDCKMLASYYSVPVREGNDYMIVDLSSGEVTYEGVFTADDKLGSLSGQELSNARYNVRKYKTTHLVLRKVPKGEYKTGDGGTKTWTTDKDYYIGVFPWTDYQYWYVFDFPTAGVAGRDSIKERPSLGYNRDIRGTTDPTVTPPQQCVQNRWMIIEWLNGKTHMNFDLPTEIMHEIATRAGTTTTYFWGTDASLASQYAVFGVPAGQDVGTKLPNAWGLYDMVGNNWQWCLDVLNGTRETDDAFTPATGTHANRVVRGQDALTSGANLKSSAKSSASGTGATYSFRIAYIVPNE